ncbi:hypothetical protein GTP38_25405 [Duganella sp. FT94W]|uniref:Uncharacterized protein n=1 Tax=Duganella lactea TaxID=2692173 RepID=A0ABW9VF50_9BURK|nr:hypothetical protein [Duganella lactea]MYM37666.1 hypothetical protein [Duganella lactea]
MALDFAVLSEDEKSADIVALEWEQHDILIGIAEQNKLTQVMRFADYFEEVNVTPAQLPKLVEELGIIKKMATSPDIVTFAGELEALSILAIKRQQRISAVPD